MAEPDEVDSLLAAYLCQDIAPEERARVEHRLAEDPAFRVSAKELSALLQLVAKGKLPVPAALAAALKDRLAATLTETEKDAPAVLLAASLTGDLTSAEQTWVREHLKTHPEAGEELRALSEVSRLLRRHALPVRPELERELRQRLTARLPKRKGAAAAPTLRVYATQPSRFDHRIVWAASIAALALLALGLWQGGFFGGTQPDANPIAVEQRTPHPTPKQLVTGSVPHPDVATTHGADSQTKEPVVTAGTWPVPPAPPTSSDRTEELARRDTRSAGTSPRSPARGPDNGPSRRIADNDNEKAPERQPAANVADSAPAREAAAPSAQNSSRPSQGTTFSGGGGITVAGSSATTGTAADANTTGATPDNSTGASEGKTPTSTSASSQTASAVVSAVIGTVQASTVGGVITLDVHKELPSGSEVSTDQGKVLLLVGVDGRLAVNSNSNLSFELRDKTVYVTLNAGEIGWQSSGTALVLNAGGVSVNNGKNLDVKLDGNRLILSVMSKSASIGAKGKTAAVKAGEQAVVTLGSDAVPEKKPYAGQPDSWAKDLGFPVEAKSKTHRNKRR